MYTVQWDHLPNSKELATLVEETMRTDGDSDHMYGLYDHSETPTVFVVWIEAVPYDGEYYQYAIFQHDNGWKLINHEHADVWDVLREIGLRDIPSR